MSVINEDPTEDYDPSRPAFQGHCNRQGSIGDLWFLISDQVTIWAYLVPFPR